MPQLYMIGGPNGAGKTSAALALLPNLLDCYEYVNADAIAAALSPFSPESTAIQAGRLMLERIRHLSEQKKDFAFETTMASKSFAPLLKKCKKEGYQINLIYLWLESPELAIARVFDRVQNGGHHIPDDIVRRRYQRSIQNLINIYMPLADEWALYNNSLKKPIPFAKQDTSKSILIMDKIIWDKFKGKSYEQTK
jgi:predicted ABC-type ATPase